MHTIALKHTTETGHRLPNHEGGHGKCARLHGHSYSFEVSISTESLDEDGFTVDFGTIKRILDQWDHRLLLWVEDPIFEILNVATEDLARDGGSQEPLFPYGILPVPFIPTAENMAVWLAQRFVREHECVVFAQVEVCETAKTIARYYCSHEDVIREDAAAEALVA